MENRTLYTDRASTEKTFYSAIKSNFNGIGATKASLRKLLVSIDSVGWSRREECGRVDRRGADVRPLRG